MSHRGFAVAVAVLFLTSHDGMEPPSTQDGILEVLLTQRAAHLRTFPNAWVLPVGEEGIWLMFY